jgi:hypothetical protein
MSVTVDNFVSSERVPCNRPSLHALQEFLSVENPVDNTLVSIDMSLILDYLRC